MSLASLGMELCGFGGEMGKWGGVRIAGRGIVMRRFSTAEVLEEYVCFGGGRERREGAGARSGGSATVATPMEGYGVRCGLGGGAAG